MASRPEMRCLSACSRRSVAVSTSTVRIPPSGESTSRRMDGRIRRSRGSVERQTAHSQAIIGTPCDVPVPSSVTLRLNNPVPAVRRADEAHAKLEQDLLEDLTLLGCQVAPGRQLEERQDLNH